MTRLFMDRRAGGFELRDVTACPGAIVSGDEQLSIVTARERWANAAIWTWRDTGEDPLGGAMPLTVAIDATVQEGRLGFSVAREDLAELISEEKECTASAGRSVVEIAVPSPRPKMRLVTRNTATGGVASRAVIHGIRSFLNHSGAGPTVWIDVGAHLGEKTFAAAEQDPSLLVFAFEPNLRIASRQMGRLRNYVVLPIAIAEHDGSAPFYLNRFAAASSLLDFRTEGLQSWVGGDVLHVEEVVQVPTMRLDTFLDRAGISKVAYLKIDAQGADLAVIRSAGERLRDVERITLEVQTTAVPLYEGASTRQDVLDFLGAAGFELISSEPQSHQQEENLEFVRAPLI